MDSTFQVPKIPLVSVQSLTANNKILPIRKISKSTSMPLKSSAASLSTTKESRSSHLRKVTKLSSKPKESPSQVSELLPTEAFRNLNLCPSCSETLKRYLSPIESYIKFLINQVDTQSASGLEHSSVSNVKTLSTFADNGQSQTVKQMAHMQKKVLSQGRQPAPGQLDSTNSSGTLAYAKMNNTNNNSTENNGTASSKEESEKQQSENYQSKEYESVPMKYESNVQPSNGGQVTSAKGRAIHKQEQAQGNTSHHLAEEQQVYRHSTSSNHEHLMAGDTSAQSETNKAKPSEIMTENVHFRGAQSTQNAPGAMGRMPASQSDQVSSSWTSENHVQRDSLGTSSSSSVLPEYAAGNRRETTETEVENDTAERSQDLWDEAAENSPFAYVTIAYDNLSAVNAILLANSIQLYNNKVLNIYENNDPSCKRIVDRYHIPTVILLCDSIDGTLRKLVYQVFDKVIESKYQDAVLLNDESLGIQQYKIHLWKELAYQYEKCVFLESSTMVVGEISELWLQEELSAAVDTLLTDHFNCSVFVFEPDMATYKKLLSFGMQLKLEESNASHYEIDTLDEMTLLNQFFASKWKKLSFIYNFTRNGLSYTQLPAYLKFGNNIRVVNFASNASQQSFYGVTPTSQTEKLNSSQQPWNFKFDLNKAQLEENPLENAPVDNYVKFYILCFVRRLWPLIQQTVTPYLLARHNGRTEWTVFELVQILGRESGEGFAQNPVTMSRKKSWAVDPHLHFQPTDEADDEVELENENETGEQHSSQAEGAQSDGEELEESEIQEEQNKENKRQWEEGRVDWIGQHQSDRIINRLKNLIQ